MDSFERKDLNTEKRNVESSNIDELTTIQILELINNEDSSIPKNITKALKDIEKTIDICVESLKLGGRIFYIGAGTSGRLGVLDASEIPPTFSAPKHIFTGIIAGGDAALKNSIEGAEDNAKQALIDLKTALLKKDDVLIGVSASGAAKYVQSALVYAKSIQAKTVYLLCNKAPYLNAKTDAVIAMNLFISPDHFIASFRVSSVSSVVNDFDEITNSVSVFLRLEVFSINSIGSEPVINRWFKFVLVPTKLSINNFGPLNEPPIPRTTILRTPSRTPLFKHSDKSLEGQLGVFALYCGCHAAWSSV